MSSCLKNGGRLGKPILIHQRRDKPAFGKVLTRMTARKRYQKKWSKDKESF